MVIIGSLTKVKGCCELKPCVFIFPAELAWEERLSLTYTFGENSNNIPTLKFNKCQSSEFNNNVTYYKFSFGISLDLFENNNFNP